MYFTKYHDNDTIVFVWEILGGDVQPPQPRKVLENIELLTHAR